MYGLVNKAVHELIVNRFGQDKWIEICSRAQVDPVGFVGMNPYPDEITYRLVQAASEVLRIESSAVLEAFGEYWTVYTAEQGYGEMLKHAGRTLVEFLQNLDHMHARIGLSFPQLAPPSFRLTDVTESGLRLHYHSTRRGLAPLVIGLLKGLGQRFNTKLEVVLDKDRNQGADHDEFVIRFVNA